MASNTLTGTAGNDILNAPGSVTTDVRGLAGADTITLSLESDIGDAGAGDDSILLSIDGASKATALGGAGNDTITLGTALLTNASYIRGDAGNDSISFAGGAGFTVNNGAFVAGNAGDDTLTVTAAATLVTLGGGQGADNILLQAGGTSSNARGGKGKDSLTINGAFTGSTIGGNEGFDTIRATGITGTTSLLGGGKGGDSIAFGTAAVATIAGGYLNDTITGFGAFSGGIIYGDKVGTTTGGTGTGSEADGADLISLTAGTLAAGTSVYGAGGNDTINVANTSGSSSVVIDGGKGADFIGRTTVSFSATNASVMGGAGHDTIRFRDAYSAVVLGGAGNDSIAIGSISGVDSSIHGGAGADSITVLSQSFETESAILTINGGDGADVITLGSYTAGQGTTLSAATIGNVVYGSGDKIVLNATNAVSASANWLGDTQIFIANNLASANTQSTIAGMTQAGSVLVFTSGDDLVIGITGKSSIVPSTQALINVIDGASVIKTTAVGAQTFNSTNFGFTLSTSNNDLVITFT